MTKLYFLTLRIFLFSILGLTSSGVFAQAPTYTTALGTGSNGFPFNSATNKAQYIYAPTDFSPAPISGYITDIYIRSANANTSTYTNLTIQIGNTSLTSFTTGPYETGLTTVYSSASETITSTIDGWVHFTLQTPFLYTGTNNIVVEVSMTSTNGFGIRQNTVTGINHRLYGSVTSSTGTANTGQMVLGMNITPAGPCTSPPVPGNLVSTANPVCTGSGFMLRLNGGTTGTGQTYQWQSSTDSTTWNNLSGATNVTLLTSQTVTTFYRVVVTCGSSSVTSAAIKITTPPLVQGTFTINSAATTGGTNFQSFSDAALSIGCGINGPVVLNVVAGSGPYNEQVSLGNIYGTSATNTITVNGNGATLQFAPPSTAKYVLELNGTKHLKIDSLTIRSIGTTYGWGIHLTNGADYNKISKCTIDVSEVTSTTSSNSGGIIGSGSATSNTTDGSSSYDSIMNNTIIGGYQGIIINGASASETARRNFISNNTIQDFYAIGIELTENDSTVITNNDINRRNRVATTTFEGITLGAGNQNVLVNANRIHDTHTSATTQSGTAYGIYATACDAPIGAENKVTNNLIYNFNSTTGIIYGLYNSSSNGIFYYHNTVVLDHAAATSGTTRGLYQTTAASNIRIINNIFYITRGGTGIKYLLYFNTPPTTPFITSNYNNLYMGSTSGTTNGIGYYENAGFTTLAAWRTANGGAYDQQSISVNPLFTGNYLPSNTASDTAGTFVGVMNDILGNARSTTKPDVGAYEFGTGPLPVKLVHFSAVSSKEDALISWATATEVNTRHFVIERSFDGSRYSPVQTVAAKGNSTALTNYTATDFGVWNTAVTSLYYRLKMVDADGKFVYSRTVALSNKPTANTIQVFPNPVLNELYVKLTMSSNTKVAVTLTDMAGRRLLSNSYTAATGTSIISIPGMALLKPGVYTIMVDAGGNRQQFSVVK